ncbi:MAG: hypothetical protein ACYDBB_22995 [Armatimonadota bacterium]
MECPHCGFEMPEGLKVCAWCEQPLDVPAAPPLPRHVQMIRGALLICALLFIATLTALPFIVGYGKHPPIELRARMQLRNAQLYFLNGDTFDWREVVITLRSGRPAVDYRYTVEAIPVGQTHRVALREFRNADHRAFNPATQEILTVGIRCQTPQGPGTWYGGLFGFYTK